MTLLPDDLRSRDFRKILLIKLSAVGDAVHTLPVLNKLRRRYPAARLDWLTTPAIAELLRHNPAITNVIEFVREEWLAAMALGAVRKRGAAGRETTGRALRPGARFAGSIPQRGIRARHRHARAHRLRPAARARMGRHREQCRRRSASTHGREPGREAGSPIRTTFRCRRSTYTQSIIISASERCWVSRRTPLTFPSHSQSASDRIDFLLRRHRVGDARLVVISPSGNWETKHWHDEKFAEVARYFLQRGYGVILVGAARERPVCGNIARLAPAVIDLAGETMLSELAALIRRADICIGHDFGPMHLAVALDRPVVSLFGPSDPVWAGPYHRDGAVVTAKLPCSPCYLRQLSRCRHGHACMHGVPAQAVIERMENILCEKVGDAGRSGRPLHRAAHGSPAPLRRGGK